MHHSFWVTSAISSTQNRDGVCALNSSQLAQAGPSRRLANLRRIYYAARTPRIAILTENFSMFDIRRLLRRVGGASALLVVCATLAHADSLDEVVEASSGHLNAAHHTWSIVVHAPEEGLLIAATSSRYFNVLRRICRARAGTGIVISKGRGNPANCEALDLIAAGESPKDALAKLVRQDPSSDQRQVIVMSADGKIAAHSGAKAGRVASEIVNRKQGYVIAGNGLEDRAVLAAMEDAYRKARGSVWERVIEAMRAGMSAGGEVRPENSAGICYAPLTPSGSRWKDQGEYVAVADSMHPVEELARLVTHERARVLLERGFAAYERDEAAEGDRAFAAAADLLPSDPEIPFWRGYFLFRSGEEAKGVALVERALKSAPWGGVMLRRFGGEEGRQLVERATCTAPGSRCSVPDERVAE
ncbi:MAG: DUF1028 domain-containing protein [Bdellovibrionales bacterium]|nr:DUF1028 domain-containing protein [Bdellovibrionales bacterium]